MGKSLNFEFIQEVQVKTGSYQAEFGRSTGGVVNVITKSGGNEFHGDAFGYYYSDALQSSRKQEPESYRRLYTGSYLVEAFRKSDAGADLGGYLLKDTLWFFGAYDRVMNNQDQKVTKDYSPYGGPPEGKVYVARETDQLWSAKLTWRPGANHSLVLSGFGDPSRQDGPLPGFGLDGEPSSFMGTFETGGNDAVLHYQGVLGAHAVIEAQASRYSMRYMTTGPGASIPLLMDITTPLYAASGEIFNRGGIGVYGNEHDTRDGLRLGTTFFVGHLAGEHEIKAGLESERVVVDNLDEYSGGQYTWLRCPNGELTAEGCPAGEAYYRHIFHLSAVPPGGELDPDIGSYMTPSARINPSTRNDAAYLQDTWRLSPTLTLNLGLRAERQKMYDRHGTLRLSINDELAPRVGFIWDFRGEGRSKLFGSWGRFYETVPMAISYVAFQDVTLGTTSNHDPIAVACDPALNADPSAYLRCRLIVGSAAPVDPAGVRGEFIDEALLGAETTVGRDLVLGAKLIYRTLGRVIDDGAGADGYYIGNPGHGALGNLFDMSYSWELPAPMPKRTFKGVELTASKRLSDHWLLLASYLWSKLEGNYDGNYVPDINESSPNLGSGYDFAEDTIHTDGYLGNDRRHQAKVAAAYVFPFGLTVGASAYYRTGVPISALGYADGSHWFYLSQRGAWGRTDPEYEADLHLGYALKVGGAEVNVLLDVFHVLNRQGETGRDERYNLDWTLDVLDYSTGKPLPPIKPGTPCTSAVPPDWAASCNPGFNKANAWQAPRSVRLGVSVTF